MLDRLPKPLELAVFVFFALVCATAVALSPKKDSALFFAGVPLFFVAAMMGFWRSERRRSRQAAAESADQPLP